jgi:glycosyltransferase involved in cell wall biosynthesis
MKVFVITSEWPHEKHPISGIFVKSETQQLNEKFGVQYHVFHAPVSAWIRNPWKFRQKIRTEINQFQPDLIHIHWAFNSWFVRGLRIPQVITFRGFDYPNLQTKFDLKRRFLNLFSVAAWNKNNHLIFVKDHPRRTEFSGYSTIIPSGLNEKLLREVFHLDRSKLKEKYGIPSHRIMISFIGPGKNASHFRIKNKNSDWFLAFWDELNQQFPETYHLLWLEDLSQREVLENVHASDFFFLTSTDEGSPNIIKEALVLGTYFFSTNCGDVAKHLEKYPESGELITLKIEETILQLRSNRPHSLGLNEEFLKVFGSENQANRVWEVYQAAMKQSTK